MPRWEHIACGRIHEGGNAPPLLCPSCADQSAASAEAGWSWVPPKTKAEVAAAVAALPKRRSIRRIGKTQRERIYARDGRACVVCGSTEEDSLTIDHVIPVSGGGGKGDDNLQTMCKDCNGRKGDGPMSLGRPELQGPA